MFRLLIWLLCAPSFLALASAAMAAGLPDATPSSGPARKLALLIAVQGYERFGPEWQNLDGAINDIVLMREVLTKRFGFAAADIAMVCDDAKTCRATPTRKGIVAAFESLTRRAQLGDLVYIHYSGHGSTVPDVNGDEPGLEGRDSTLVPIDARDVESREILDDEIQIWLSRLGQQTEDVVFVSDSCHSGTITRGATGAKVRGAPIADTRDYSWSKQLDLDEVPPPRHLVRISAARDTQKAYEYEAPNGKAYGRLTWYWAKALQTVVPGQCYDAAYRSVTAMMPPREQQPVIEGACERELFQARFAQRPREIAAVRVTEQEVEFDEGLLSGLTIGSVFQRVGGDGSTGQPAVVRVRLTNIDAYSARGIIEGQGKAECGDLFAEVQHVYVTPRLRVSVRANDPKDTAAKEALQQAIGTMGAALDMVSDGQHADLILSLTRRMDRGAEVLECWMLDDADQLYAPDLRIAIGHDGAPTASDVADAVTVVKRNVERISRNQGILDVASQGLTVLGDEVTAEALQLIDAADSDSGPDIVTIPFGKAFSGKPKRQRVTPLRERFGQIELPAKELIAFRVTNRSKRARFFYLVNIAPNGTAHVIFPRRGFDDNFRMPAEMEPRIIPETAVEVDGSGDTYIWFVTETPTNVWALEGEGFDNGQGGANARGARNALEQLLQQAGGGVARGPAPSGKTATEFAARKIVIRVPDPSGG